jgi:putative acetyltransferase
MQHTLPEGITILEEQVQDVDGIRHVNRIAFDGEYEAEVVDRLRENCPTILSLVAKDGEDVVGHILFSPAHIVQSEGGSISGMGLGPLAVLPGYQGLGIGSALCQGGLERMEIARHPFVVVLGHPSYYPRFGFEKASTYGISSAFKDVPDEAFMICFFDREVMSDVSGVAYYRSEFNTTS